jgi:hypothetical protein
MKINKKLIKIYFCLIFALLLCGCNSGLTNFNPDMTNQKRNQLNGPNNIALMGSEENSIKGDWFGISSEQKNCYFSFKEDGTYDFILFNDSAYQSMSEHETGSYFLLGNNQLMFVSNTVTSLPDNLLFNIDEYRRKITFFNNPDKNYISSYEIYNSEFYDII